MGHAILVDKTSVRLAGALRPDIITESTVQNRIQTHLDLSTVPDETHIGYSKLDENGEVHIKLFDEFQP